MDPVLTMSGVELARRIRAGEMSSIDAVEAHIGRVQAVNGTLNAVVRDRFEAARAEAQRADTLLRDTPEADLPPLHGVPCTIKECFALQGMPNASGLVSRRDRVSTSDAPTVARLRAAGAIPLGVTNTSELCMWMESYNHVYGRTCNPYDATRIVGGSSGGEGAIIGAGGSPFGLGSDIGGSIRMPAFFNGVFGHKPSGGLVPGTGQFPNAENEALRYLATGPLARRAEDLMPLLRILAGPDGEDAACTDMPLGDPDCCELRGLHVVHIADNGLLPVSADLRRAQQRCADALAERGADVERVRLPALRRSLDIWSSMLGAAQETPFRRLLGGGAEDLKGGRELVRLMLGRSDHTFPAILLALLERIAELTPKRIERFVAMGCELRAELTALIGERGVLLYPSYTSTAPPHGRPIITAVHWVYTAILNVMEIPVTQVPLGLDELGLPLGVQVGAVHGNDHLTIAVALELERRFGGWVPPR